jgi:hypothetical protein
MKQFLSIAEAAKQLDVSDQHIRNLITGIRSHTPERYTESDIFGRGKIAVRFVALQDYANYGDNLKIAPPYRPTDRERELGILSPTVNPHDVAVELMREAVKVFGRIDL